MQAGAPAVTPADRDPAPLFGDVAGRVLLERYELLDRVGSGGGGTVWRAHDRELERDVAIKMLNPSARRSARMLARLRKEAMAIAAVPHPNVVDVYDVGESDVPEAGGVFIAMELVEGMDLKDWLLASRRSTGEILDVFRQIAAGLAAAHDRGLVHRDLKPGNVLVGADGRTRVVDFGIVADDASSSSDAPQDAASASTSGTSGRLDSLTATGTVMGTPAFMAPEQHVGAPVTARADQYAFGVSLYRALYDRPAFASDTYEGLYKAKVAGAPEAAPRNELGDRTVPRHVRRALVRMLMRDANARFSDMREVQAALQSPRPLVPIGVGVAGVGVLLVLAWPSPTVDAPDCEGVATEAAEQAWGSDPGARVRAAMTDAAAAERLGTRIDELTAAWVSVRAEVCRDAAEGEIEPPVAEGRISCLRDNRRALAAATTLAEDGGPEIDSTRLLRSLSSPHWCRTVSASRIDPARRERMEALLKPLVRAQTMTRAGDPNGGLELATQGVADARKAGEGLVVARGLRVVAHAQRELVQVESSIATLRESYDEALGAGADAEALQAALDLAQGLDDASQVEEARRWMRTADSIAARLEISTRTELRILSIRSAIVEHEGKLDEARELRERAVELSRAADPHGTEHAEALVLLGTNLARSRRFEEALAAFSAGLERLEAIYGTEDPTLIGTLDNLAGANIMLDRFEEGTQVLERAKALAVTTYGPDSPVVARRLPNLGRMYQSLGRNEEAEAALVEALGFAREHGPPAFVANVLGSLSRLMAELGQHERAKSYATEALELSEELVGPDHPELARPLLRIAEAERELGNLEESERFARRLVALMNGRDLARTQEGMFSRAVLVRVLTDRGHVDEAVALAQSLIDDARAVPATGETLTRVLYSTARARQAAGEAGAAALAEEGLEHIAADPAERQERNLRDEIEAWLETVR